MPPRISEDGKDELTLSESRENSEGHVTPRDAPLEKKDVLEKAREELAEEVRKSYCWLFFLLFVCFFNKYLFRKEIANVFVK